MARDFLDTELLQLTPKDAFTGRDAVQGVLITGGIGSGKTSGSGRALAAAYLRAGMGGLVLCAKPEEAELWRRYCAENGRSESLIEWIPGSHGFNVIGYELARSGRDGLNNVIEVVMRMLEISRAASPSPGRQGDEFWLDTTRQILRASVPVLFAATGNVRIEDLLKFVRSAPASPAQMRDPEWQRQSFFCRVFLDAKERLDDASGEQAVSYWLHDFATLDAKTRGNILISLTTSLDRFTHGWLKDTFCSDTNIVPELTFHGAVILLNMPALTLNEDGIIAQQLFKYMWQRAVLARNGLDQRQRSRPLVLWIDEAHIFVNPFDAEFLATCRGSRACVVFLTQSLPTFYAKMGGDNAHDRVHHLLGNFATRIWHNNACAETNEWAAKTIGRSLQQRGTFNRGEGSNTNFGMNMGDGSNWGSNEGRSGHYSTSAQGGSSGGGWNSGSSAGGSDNRGRNRGYGTNSSESWGYSETMDYQIEPGAFSRMLKTGGPAHRNRVSAIWFQAGRRFQESGGNAFLAEFKQ